MQLACGLVELVAGGLGQVERGELLGAEARDRPLGAEGLHHVDRLVLLLADREGRRGRWAPQAPGP